MYRDEQVAAQLQLTTYPLPGRSPAMLRLLARRRARIAAGFVGILGAAATWVATLGCYYGLVSDEGVGLVFLATWPAAGLAWLASFTLTHDLQLGLPRMTRSSGQNDPIGEVARRRKDSAGARLEALVGALGRWSYVWPVLAIVLLAPLTLHGIFFLMAGAATYHPTVWMASYPLTFCEGFGWWITVSVAVTWLPHLVLCGLALRTCRRLATSATSATQSQSVWATAALHLLLTAASVIPSSAIFAAFWAGSYKSTELCVAVMGVAAVLIFVTGLVFLPATYAWARRRYRAELAMKAR